jgi:GT2 family glycosyltransferase/glycosyltransferase involved in cell wall biosynthesis
VFYRLKALYLRYAARHADRLGGFSLPRDKRRPGGHVEQILRVNGRTRLVGWSTASKLRLSWPGGAAEVVPSIQRPDVARRYQVPLQTGFQLEAPENMRPLVLTVPVTGGGNLSLPVAHPSDPPTLAARRRLKRAFVMDLFRAAPALLKYALSRDAAARAQVKRALGLETITRGLPLDRRFLSDVPSPVGSGPITIILPVYNGHAHLAEALQRVEAHTDLDWRLVLIEDASTDPRVRPFLRKWAEPRAEQVTLVELDENLGFVGAVNRGFAEAAQRAGHIVVLNSDAMVPDGWASRLIAPLDIDPQIASATPMSNDAEIFSVPMIGHATAIPPGLVDRVDATARRLSVPDRLPSAPTGVGFCMALSGNWFEKAPQFDTAFGRGYGEEVDWCQKTRKQGARHVGVPNLFVEHRGGQSFGGDLKAELVLRANAMIAGRYPAYDLEVQTYIGRDPLRTPRLALAVAMAGHLSPDALPLFLAHSMGGGAEQALEAEIAARITQGHSALVLRVGGLDRWQLEVHGRDGILAGSTGDLRDIRKLLGPVPALRIVYSCGVGDVDPVTLPDAMLSLVRPGRPDKLEARVHDYFMISPSYSLLNAQGQYRGLIGPENLDPAHRMTRPNGIEVGPRDWREAWQRFLPQCDEITVFSQSSRDLMMAAFTRIRDKLVMRPHAMIASVDPVIPPDGAKETLGILGNLNRQKGAQVLVDLAQRRAGGNAPRLVLIGNIDAAFALPSSVQHHGGYQHHEISMLAERYGVTAWLVPSIWPETFSFVTHEMLATGLPVFGFDIGAQGEALRSAPNGIPIPFDPDGDHAAAVLQALSIARSKTGRRTARRDDPKENS